MQLSAFYFYGRVKATVNIWSLCCKLHINNVMLPILSGFHILPVVCVLLLLNDSSLINGVEMSWDYLGCNCFDVLCGVFDPCLLSMFGLWTVFGFQSYSMWMGCVIPYKQAIQWWSTKWNLVNCLFIFFFMWCQYINVSVSGRNQLLRLIVLDVYYGALCIL